MARRKSMNDIYDQIGRIATATSGRTTLRRREQAYKIADQYLSNIRNTKRFQRAQRNNRGLKGLMADMAYKYSQSVYRGLANG